MPHAARFPKSPSPGATQEQLNGRKPAVRQANGRRVAQKKPKKPCGECGKLLDPSSLARHVRTHFPSTKNECPWPGCQHCSSQLSNLMTHIDARANIRRHHCDKCFVWKSDPAALSRHRCYKLKRKLETEDFRVTKRRRVGDQEVQLQATRKRSAIDEEDDFQASKRRRVDDQEAFNPAESLPYASSRVQDDVLPAPNSYAGPVAGPSSASDYTAYSSSLPLGPDNGGLTADFAHTNGLWYQQRASPFDGLRATTVTPVHMDGPTISSQPLNGLYADEQQYYNGPGPSAQAAPQAFVAPQPQPSSLDLNLDWDDSRLNTDFINGFAPSAPARVDAQPQFVDQAQFNVQPDAYAQPAQQFNAQPQFAMEAQPYAQPQFAMEAQPNAQLHFDALPQPVWQNETFEQAQMHVIPEPVPEYQYLPLPPLAQPTAVAPPQFQLFEPPLPLEAQPEPYMVEPAAPAPAPQAENDYTYPAGVYGNAPLPESPRLDAWRLFEDMPAFPDLRDVPAQEFSFEAGLNLVDAGAGLDGIPPPDTWADAFIQPTSNPLASDAAYGLFLPN